MSEGLVIGYVKHGTTRRKLVWCRNLRNFRRKVRRLMREPDTAIVALYRAASIYDFPNAILDRLGGEWGWAPWSQAGIRRLMGKGWKP